MLSKATILFALSSVFVAIVGPLAARIHVLPPMAGAALMLLGGTLGICALITATIVAIRHQAYFPAMVGTLGLLPFLAVLAAVVQVLRYPAINDIATDTGSPPSFLQAPTLSENAGRDFTFPPEFAPVIQRAYPDLAPRPLALEPILAYQRARDIASQSPWNWEITRDDPDSLAFEAVAETRLFRWKDDIVVQVRPGSNGDSMIHMRSKSREGKSDLGANAQRIRRFLAALAP